VPKEGVPSKADIAAAYTQKSSSEEDMLSAQELN
jgi:hypothetical protein